MGWVDDARKLMQDFVAPELHAITARLDSMDRVAGEREKAAIDRHSALTGKLEATRREILLQVEVSRAQRGNGEFRAQLRQAGAQPGTN